ncbi:MAG: hypothetical protein PVG82_00020 [Chromatiales bacterium]|jgi:hypothetical protein
MEPPADDRPDWGPRGMLDWLCAGRADYRAFQRRRGMPGYRRRLGWCKNLWICAAIAMALNPAPAFVFPTALVAALISFVLLDETEP